MPITGKEYIGSANLVPEAQEQDLNPTSVVTSQANGDVKLTPVSFFATGGDLDNKADLVDGKVPASQLPSYVDDVLEFPNVASFPFTGESGKIYVALDTNRTYRWGGIVYVEISSSLALGETSSTAYRGDRGKIAYDHTFLLNNPHGVTAAQVGLGNVDNTSDVNKPISNAQAAVNATKANDADVLHKTGNETKTGNLAIQGTLDVSSTINASGDIVIAPNKGIAFGGQIAMIYDSTSGLFKAFNAQTGESVFNINPSTRKTSFMEEVTIAPATQPTSAVQLQQLGIKTTQTNSETVIINTSLATSYRLNPGVSEVILPLLTDGPGKVLFLINNSGSNIDVKSNYLGADDIWDGGSSQATTTLAASVPMRLINDGVQWVIL